jgi:hypothetical protein
MSRTSLLAQDAISERNSARKTSWPEVNLIVGAGIGKVNVTTLHGDALNPLCHREKLWQRQLRHREKVLDASRDGPHSC